MLKILAIGAHPDDLEFGCGGILIQEVQKGNHVKMIVCSRGEAGTSGSPDIREQESRNAAQLIGAEIEFLDYNGDCHIEYTIQNCFVMAQIIRDHQPDILLIPTLNENQHPDHWKVAKICRDAARYARYGGLKELRGNTHKISSIYQYRITTNTEKKADIVIDISDVYKKWVEVMECHQTQIQSKKYIELQTTHARNLGLEAGVEYALELFIHDPILLKGVSHISQSARNF